MPLKRDESGDELDRLLRRSRPVASEKLVQSLSGMVRSSAPPRFRVAARRAFALSFSTALLIVLASFGGIGYACTVGHDTVNVVKRIAVPSHHIEHGDHSPAHYQYGPPPPPWCRKGEVPVHGQCVPIPCNAGQERVDGVCVPVCKTGQERVDGRCVPVCKTGQERVNGSCVPVCKSDETRGADGRCVPIPCKAGQERVNGTCVPVCKADEIRVDGRCVPIPCKAGQERVNGSCVPACKANEERVNGQCLPQCKQGQVRNANGSCTAPKH